MVGDWEFRSEYTDPEKGLVVANGKETVRPIGEIWVQATGLGEGYESGPNHYVMTLGYDPAAGQFVGTFTSSLMTTLWVYAGQQEGDQVLNLDTTGPSFGPEGGTAPYRDQIQWEGPDLRRMVSHMKDGDGNWFPFMTMTYRRVG
jgi:hypothetical protein